MSEFTNVVCRIEKIEKHPNADSLSIAVVMGDYPVIFRTGDYQVGDLVGYVSIDAIVPDTIDYFFLCPQKYEKYIENEEIKTRAIGPKYSVGSVPESYRRIRAKKIRSVYSQGLLVSVPEGLKEGDSLTEVLGLKRYEEEEEENIPAFRSKKSSGANAEKAPIGWSIPYYDIEGLRKYLGLFSEGEEVVIMEKLHGSNASFCHDGNKLHVKSRNFYKKRSEECPWWDAALRYNLEEKLAKYPFLVAFCELVGMVRGFRYDAEVVDGALHTKLHFFDIFDVKNNRYLDYNDRIAILKELGLPSVPELYRGPWKSKEEMYAFAEGQSTLGSHIREGIVVLPVKERYAEHLGRVQFKLIGEGYNLAKH